MTFEKIIFVKKRTRLEELLARHVTTSQAKFYLEQAGHSYDEYESEHHTYVEGLQKVVRAAPDFLRVQINDKNDLPSMLFGREDLIITIGDPGLFVNTAKYVSPQPIISVNPDCQRYSMALASCNIEGFQSCMHTALAGKANIQKLTMAEARLDDGQIIYALNDLFIGRRTHVSARYLLEIKDRKEAHSSSGVIVSTGSGSTGWMTSILLGASRLAGKEGIPERFTFPPEAEHLFFMVREPFPSPVTETALVQGRVDKESPLSICSQMPHDGVLFSDGVESDYLSFTAGRTAVIQPSERKAHLVKQ